MLDLLGGSLFRRESELVQQLCCRQICATLWRNQLLVLSSGDLFAFVGIDLMHGMRPGFLPGKFRRDELC